MLNRCPQLVRCTPLIVAPKPPATKNTPNISAPAAGFHFTHAESESASRERIKTQIHPPKKMPDAKRQCSVTHVQPSRYPCSPNTRSPGIHVIRESNTTSTN